MADKLMSWTEYGQIRIGHAAAQHVNIDVMEHASENWLVANIEVACGIWKGAFQWQFLKGELRQFGQQVQTLYQTLTGTAVLEPLEPHLTLRLTGDSKGHIEVEGRAEDELQSGTYLVFHFSLDQTDLASVGSALIAVDPA
jgi:hypothetical protein